MTLCSPLHLSRHSPLLGLSLLQILNLYEVHTREVNSSFPQTIQRFPSKSHP